MTTDDDFIKLAHFAKKVAGTFKALAEQIGAPSHASVQMWSHRGVPHKYRMTLLELYGAAYESFKKREKEERISVKN